MSKYFDRFPVVNYDGKVAKNLLTKVDFSNATRKDIFAKFDYVLDDNTSRPDLLSYVTYNTPQYDWLIYLTNQVIDPYHGYYKKEEEFELFIEAKYYSQRNARDEIAFYRNNWAADRRELTPFVYDNLDESVKKYWSPKLNNTNQVTSYMRLQEDWIVSTNKVLKVTVLDSEWIPDTGPVKQGDTKINIVDVDHETNTLTVNHVQGTLVEGPFLDTEITNIELLYQNISEEEAAYWEPVSHYDNEAEKNELRRYISLLRNSYLQDFDNKFVGQLKS